MVVSIIWSSCDSCLFNFKRRVFIMGLFDQLSQISNLGWAKSKKDALVPRPTWHPRIDPWIDPMFLFIFLCYNLPPAKFRVDTSFHKTNPQTISYTRKFTLMKQTIMRTIAQTLLFSTLLLVPFAVAASTSSAVLHRGSHNDVGTGTSSFRRKLSKSWVKSICAASNVYHWYKMNSS